MLDLLLPQRCLVCGGGGAQLCEGCRAGLPALEPPLCGRCGAPTAWPVPRCRECAGRRLAFATARAAVAYDDGVRRLVAGWKERGLRRLAETAAELVAERLPRPVVAVVTFVPPDEHRRLHRGHHPAERLARPLASRWELPCEALLERTRTAPRQRGLPLAARRRNVAGSFRAPEPVRGPVLLVDDVYTSGATVAAAASALRTAGARRVEVVTFARVVRMPGVGLGRAPERPI
ncbi:MAG TPA: double zinc ribbon domain-containing protein [Gaiellaceae bacterium]|jgi:predicted amidophosphoribosyltransferase|nr:double zinc ribbon domain-containing protein [Gaiellaceae bacterium]